MKTILGHVVPCAVSALAAAGLLVLISGGVDKPSPPEKEAKPAPSRHSKVRLSSSPRGFAQGRRLSAMEQRLRSLETDVTTTDSAPRKDAEPSMNAAADAITRKRTHDAWQDQLDAHASEPRDHGWAPSAESSFSTNLGALSTAHGFEHVATTCRTSTCTSTIAFDNYGDALAKHAQLLHHDYDVSCARNTVLPEPSDVEARYVATVLYECGDKG